jgi:hypothetical protein
MAAASPSACAAVVIELARAHWSGALNSITAAVDEKARLPLDQRRNEGSPGAFYQVAFPVPWDRSIFNLRWPLPYGDRIYDLASTCTVSSGVARATNTSLRAKMPNQLFFQSASGLHE